jgi:dsDNA-specific endonuclease/ATPase MutS2
VITNHLSVEQRITNHLLVEQRITDHLSVEQRITDHLSVEQRITDHLSVELRTCRLAQQIHFNQIRLQVSHQIKWHPLDLIKSRS